MVDPQVIREALKNCLSNTSFSFLGEKHEGKVRDSYVADKKRFLVTSDRISAFDVIMKEPIPFKGQALNQMAAYFFEKTKDIIPNHVIAVPDPNVTAAKDCRVYPVEMIVRGYLAGSAWRAYEKGERIVSGVTLPDGLKMNQKFDQPIVTPATKADEGHDMPITREEIIEQGLVPELVYMKMEEVALKLFKRGTEMAEEKGLILVDTKYEFGDHAGELTLIDEVHTPDSSRYFWKKGYKTRFQNGEKQKQLSKEFLREWLMAKGFTGEPKQKIPTLDDDVRTEIATRYIGLYETMTGTSFSVSNEMPIRERIEKNLTLYIQ